jgi:gamma-glutamyltranspeptidase/glutathione hydrolase
MQNRGVAFSLERGALNALAPGRLPPHTLNPALAVLRDGRVMAYGTMGGDVQPQIQAALFTRHVGFALPLAEALDRPRCVLGQTWGAPRASLLVEARFDAAVIEELRAAGHDVEVLAEPYADATGHAGAVLLHPNRTLEGAHDPRADGGTAGL